MSKILVVGDNSFIGKHFHNNYIGVDITPYKYLDNYNLAEYHTILNCSITPEYKFKDYDETYDLDFLVGQKAIKNKCHYVMISTRKVYGQSDVLQAYDELSPVNPADYYSENKVKTEFKLLNLTDDYTILRASNVFGFEPNRKSFMGWCINQLKKTDKIVYDIHPDTQRDFIDINTFSKTLKLVCDQKPQGIYNIGSNEGTKVGDIAQWLIEGYGSGEFISTGDEFKDFRDQFILNTRKLRTTLNKGIGPINYEEIIKEIGEQLNGK